MTARWPSQDPSEKHYGTVKVYRHKGVEYLGREDVAAELGVSVRTIANHMKRYGHLDNIGVGKGQGNHGRPTNPPPYRGKAIEVDGTSYPSLRAFARQHSVRLGTVQDWVKRGDRAKLIAVKNGADPRWARSSCGPRRGTQEPARG